MKPVFKAGICISDLVAVAYEGENLGEVVVPAVKLAWLRCAVSSSTNAFKSRRAYRFQVRGVLEIRNNKPLRFVELINYAGVPHPSEIFIRAKMTSVAKVAAEGNGEILANYREIPAICQSVAREVEAKLKRANLGAIT